jgi:hypothetical protein
MAEWANISRESSLDLECTIFIRSLWAFIQDSLEFEQYNTDTMMSRSNLFQFGFLPSAILQNTNDNNSIYFKNLELLTENDIRMEELGVRSVAFSTVPRTMIMFPRRYNLNSNNKNQEFTNDKDESVIIDLTSNELYMFTIVQFFNMGSLTGTYHEDCNRRNCDFVINIVTGEILKNDWIYDYLDVFEMEKLGDRGGGPQSSSLLSISRTITYNSKVLFLGGFHNISLNYPIGLPL